MSTEQMEVNSRFLIPFHLWQLEFGESGSWGWRRSQWWYWQCWWSRTRQAVKETQAGLLTLRNSEQVSNDNTRLCQIIDELYSLFGFLKYFKDPQTILIQSHNPTYPIPPMTGATVVVVVVSTLLVIWSLSLFVLLDVPLEGVLTSLITVELT